MIASGDDYWNGGSGWETLGGEGNGFDATFDGNGYTISSLFIDRGRTRAIGLFGFADSSSVIRRVGMQSVELRGSSYVGGLVGFNSGSITSSYTTGSVVSGDFVGGLVGVSFGPIAKSYSAVRVTGGGNSVGGLVGQSTRAITESYATGGVQAADSSSYVGGLVGWSWGAEGEITDSYATGEVSGGGSHVGGLTGSDEGSTTESYWDTELTGKSSSGSGTGKTTSALQLPTANSGIYASWDSAAWDFGTSRQYPALKADWNGDDTPTWQEFGEQRRPWVTVVTGVARGTSSGDLIATWSAPTYDGGSDITSYDVRYILTSEEEAIPSNWTESISAWTTGTLEYTISGLESGMSYDVQVRALNTYGDGRWSKTMSAVTNSPPVFAESSPVERKVPEDTGPGELFGNPVRATDADNDSLTYSLTGDGASIFDIAASTGQLMTKESLDHEGTADYAVGVVADDGYGGVTSIQVVVSVTDVNEPPLVAGTVPDQELVVEGPAVAVKLSPYFKDPENDLLTYAALSSDESVATATIKDSEASLAPGSAGTATITVTATDPSGNESAGLIISITVTSYVQLCSSGVVIPEWTDEAGLVADCAVLLEIRDELAGDGSLNWDSGTAIEDWTGVWIAGTPGRVQRLLLGSLSLNGTVPAKIAQLDSLTRLDLDKNKLTGTIPTELGSLANLRHLHLFNNRLTGPIPAELGNLSSLKVLYISGNRLTGAIPKDLGGLGSLEQLTLDNNQLEGSIPINLGSLSNLTQLWLDNNRLTGEIPAELGNLSKLILLSLRSNRLTGEIPAEIGGLSNLTDIYLAFNSFTGCIPAELESVSAHDLAGLRLPYCESSGSQ